MPREKNPAPDPRFRPPAASDLQLRFAAERTLLAWIRTGLSLMGFGFVVARLGLFLREMAGRTEVQGRTHPGLSLGMGTVLIRPGVVVNGVAAGRHRHFLARAEPGLPGTPSIGWMGVAAAAVLSVLGVTMTLYLASLGRSGP